MPGPGSTLRQQLITKVIAALGQISTTNGYATNVGAKVVDWPRQIQGTDRANELPYIGVFDTDARTTRDHQWAPKVDRELTVQVRCYVRSNTPGEELRKIIGDLETAIGADPTWGKLAVTTMPSREGALIDSGNLEISAAVVEFTIQYATCVFNPYS